MEKDMGKFHEEEVVIIKEDKTVYIGKIMADAEDTIKLKVYAKLENSEYSDILKAIKDKHLYLKDRIENIEKKDIASMSGIEELTCKGFD